MLAGPSGTRGEMEGFGSRIRRLETDMQAAAVQPDFFSIRLFEKGKEVDFAIVSAVFVTAMSFSVPYKCTQFFPVFFKKIMFKNPMKKYQKIKREISVFSGNIRFFSTFAFSVTSNNMAMNKEVYDITRKDRVKATKKDFQQKNIFRSGMLVITDHALIYGHAGLRPEQPYRASEIRMLLVTSGEAEVEVNGIGFRLRTNSVVIVPGNGILEIRSIDADFNGQGLVFPKQSYGDAYGRMLSHPQHLCNVTDKDAELLKGYIRLFHTLLSPPRMDGEIEELAEPMVSALLKFLYMRYRKSFSGISRSVRSQDLFDKFASLVNRKVRTERNVAYYANSLGISVNYLSILTKHFVHMNAKEWIELAVVREAKLLLLESDSTLAGIAAALGFCSATQFGTFFKKHAGLTPTAYRKGDLPH